MVRAVFLNGYFLKYHEFIRQFQLPPSHQHPKGQRFSVALFYYLLVRTCAGSCGILPDFPIFSIATNRTLFSQKVLSRCVYSLYMSPREKHEVRKIEMKNPLISTIYFRTWMNGFIWELVSGGNRAEKVNFLRTRPTSLKPLSTGRSTRIR